MFVIIVNIIVITVFYSFILCTCTLASCYVDGSFYDWNGHYERVRLQYVFNWAVPDIFYARFLSDVAPAK